MEPSPTGCARVSWERGVNADPKTLSASTEADRHAQSDGENARNHSLEPVNRDRAHRLQIWLIRIRALLFVTLCATFGVLLLILPWTPKWTDNRLLLNFPAVRDIVSSGFVRGIASGLGVLDLWLGFWEAIHYHETPMTGG